MVGQSTDVRGDTETEDAQGWAEEGWSVQATASQVRVCQVRSGDMRSGHGTSRHGMSGYGMSGQGQEMQGQGSVGDKGAQSMEYGCAMVHRDEWHTRVSRERRAWAGDGVGEQERGETGGERQWRSGQARAIKTHGTGQEIG